MKQKSWYSAPEAELWVVRFEERFLQGTTLYNNDGNEKPIDDEEDLDF